MWPSSEPNAAGVGATVDTKTFFGEKPNCLASVSTETAARTLAALSAPESAVELERAVSLALHAKRRRAGRGSKKEAERS